VTVGQLMAALSEYHPDLMVDVQIEGEHVDLLSMAKTGGGLWLTLELDQDQVAGILSDYAEEHSVSDGDDEI
jgi:hypothetical protein